MSSDWNSQRVMVDGGFRNTTPGKLMVSKMMMLCKPYSNNFSCLLFLRQYYNNDRPLMEPDSAKQLRTLQSKETTDVDPVILLLAFECVANNEEGEVEAKDSDLKYPTECENICLKDKGENNTEKLLEESNGTGKVQVSIHGGEQVTETGLSPANEDLNNSTLAFPTKSLSRISTHRKITCERLKELKIIVDKAVKENKTFCIHGCCPAIRNALRQRGWIEKRWRESRSTAIFHSAVKRSRKARSTNDMALVRSASRTSWYNASTFHCDIPESSMSKASYCDISLAEEEDNIISRMLRNIEPALVWSARADTFEWGLIPKHQTINRFPRTSFATKIGLCSYLQQMHWFYEAGISDTLFPRCYCVCLPEEMQAFRDDFRLTACLSLLKWLVGNYEKPGQKPSDPKGEDVVTSSSGKVPLSAVSFAIQRIKEHINICQHGDIDIPPPYLNSHRNCVGLSFKTWDHQWDQFLTWFYQITHEGVLLSSSSAVDVCDKSRQTTDDSGQELAVKDLYERAKNCLDEVRPYWPQVDLDGMMDLWILKPGAKSRGRGIQLINRLEMVNQRLTPAVIKETRYVIQKYIERPLLIYKTKFDIRQWFLVTNSYPLTIWMYKDSYLRFSSQVFSLHKLHESIHLCNNAIQCRYTNGNDRDPALPEENMWDCYTFQTYLRAIGHADVWDECIYPGMKESIIGALLASQDNMTDVSLATNITGPNPVKHKGAISFNQRIGTRMGSYFELFGADFILTEDYRPWLIEINSCPCMASSTSVTARMCPQVLEDVIKVVIDRREKKEADTGMFELVYKQHVEPPPPYTGVCLSVQGKHIQMSSKNEVAASGGLEPGAGRPPDAGGGSGQSITQHQTDESDSSEMSSGDIDPDPECIVSEEEDGEFGGELRLKEPVGDDGEKQGAEVGGVGELAVETVGGSGEPGRVASFDLLKTFTEPEGNGKNASGKNELKVNFFEKREGSGKLTEELETVAQQNTHGSNLSVVKDDESTSESDLSLNVSRNFMTEHDILNSLKLFQEWRKSVLHTQETCRGVLGQLESFKKWHMQCSEDFRMRSQGIVPGKSNKVKISEKSRSKMRLKWKKFVHKTSPDVPQSNARNKQLMYSNKLSASESSGYRSSSAKARPEEETQRACQVQQKHCLLSPNRKQDTKMGLRKPNVQPTELGSKEPAEVRKKYWEPLAANISTKNRPVDTLAPAGDMSKNDAKIYERQKNFLEHITALNRKKEFGTCFVASSYDEMKKKAGFRPIEVVTFHPPFL